MEPEIFIALQSRMLVTDGVQLRKDGRDRKRIVEIPVTDLVLLAVKVLFGALLACRGLGRPTLAKFVGRAVDAPTRTQR